MTHEDEVVKVPAYNMVNQGIDAVPQTDAAAHFIIGP